MDNLNILESEALCFGYRVAPRMQVQHPDDWPGGQRRGKCNFQTVQVSWS